ncbi:uncharacterized protein Z518_05165 [Rhinocladiella mackenziei CBS 650.93]|uniref:Uncharacterized protein n=1 Tax=Rhinocladiella mackenziei CBS 650.93 TaxID=1442369 RepID=A0A0D2H1G6_9EURO|nr:uncharacterized protein Z518_05165 [Rhinocladiella mackenziei CBS 650.93]KIX04298.1 hypothetical protein Z518_05165 [Rhinocladiella mackenziei CBS 650.93]
MFGKTLFFLATAGVASALRPNDTTICDYYTPIVTGRENSPESQYELMLKITHTFILGNYTTPNVGVQVMGVAAPATFEGHQVNLLPYFTGGYYSTNDGGDTGVAKNFLDGGGADALLQNIPAFGNSSNQYRLLTHVYQYFGEFYGCSQQGNDVFPKYEGRASMFEVHKFMDSDKYEAGFFNQQIGLAVASVGFEEADVNFTLTALDMTFTHRCSPPAAVIPASAGPQLQSICVAPDCPLDPMADCSVYPNNGVIAQPAIANATLVGDIAKQNETEDGATPSASPNPSSSASASAASASASSTNGASNNVVLGSSTMTSCTLIALLGVGMFVLLL